MASKNYLLLSASAVLALIVGFGGAAKLAGVPSAHASFQVLGLPSWFGYFIGTCEVLGAIALFIRPLSALAALGLGIILLGAVYFHIVHTPIAHATPAILALALSVYIGLKRRTAILKFDNA